MRACGLFITGTDTGVGKTRVTAGIAAALRRMMACGTWPSGEVRLWKPVQTGASDCGDASADSWRLAAESGTGQLPSEVSGFTFPAPLAPWQAAERAGAPIDYAALVREGEERLRAGGWLLIEGAGGLAVPLADGKLIADLAADLDVPLLVVARPGLGTVNHTLLTACMARQYRLRIAAVVLNGAGDTPEDQRQAQDNAAMIADFGSLPVAGVLPWMEQADGVASPSWIEAVTQGLDWPLLLSAMAPHVGRDGRA